MGGRFYDEANQPELVAYIQRAWSPEENGSQLFLHLTEEVLGAFRVPGAKILVYRRLGVPVAIGTVMPGPDGLVLNIEPWA